MASFHFSPDKAPDAQISTDMAAAASLSEGAFDALVQATVAFLLSPGTANGQRLMTSVDDAAETHSANVNTMRNVVRSLLLFSKGSLRMSCNADQVTSDLTQLGLSAAKAAHVGSVWKANQAPLLRAAISQALMVNELVDMEWKFGVTAGTDELRRAGSTFLQLKLVLDKGASKTENVFMELTLPQFYTFLHEMEKAKAYIDSLT